MGMKRKTREAEEPVNGRAVKKTKTREGKRDRVEKAQFIFSPRPDWHTAELPQLATQEVTRLPSQHTVDALQKYAYTLLEEENTSYNASHLSGSSSHKFLSTIMSSGTLEDKVSALTLLVQESPVHAMKAFENLLGLARKKRRNQALMALAALKDLLGQGAVLPGRKLRAFGKQPQVLSAFQGKTTRWNKGEPLPSGLQKIHLLVWAYEDWLKQQYFEILQVLEQWCSDEVEYARSRALTYVFELLKDKPEQEENLLRLLVNKLGDTERKIASRASYLLLQLETLHPAMKMIITNSVEADSLFRPGQSLHAKYYAIITLNQTIFSQKEEAVANRLLEIYFSLFVHLLKPTEKDDSKPKINAQGQEQHGGGKAGKMAAKKRKAQERKDDADIQLGDRMVAQILAGVNRAFPYADTSDPTFEKQIDTLFRVTHNSNFNTAVQALMLIQQISTNKHYGAERFYRTLYESLLDPRLIGSSKQVMYLNLLYKSLKADLNAKRVQAFVKRLLQVVGMHEPPFVCGVLYLISELEVTFPSIRSMVTDAEIEDEDEEEHFQDVPEEGETDAVSSHRPTIDQVRYDPRKRDPEHAKADRSCLWDLLPFLQHFHPSVSLFANSLLLNEAMPPKPDTTQHTLMHFLDRFVYRSARTKSSASMHGSSIMQPTAGSEAADILIKPGQTSAAGRADVTSKAFWRKKAEDVAAEDVFFHQYFNTAGNRKKKGGDKQAKKGKRAGSDSEGSDDDGEDEIWKAITSSKPEVEGGDDDDDVSLGDLEEAYSDRDAGSEGGIDLGGGGDDVDGEGLTLDDGSDAEAMDEMPDLDDDDEAMWDDEDDLPEDFEQKASEEDEEEQSKLSESQKKRKERKKLKSLPTFASADDYAKLLGGNDEDEEEYD